jgi:methionine--tRNA ligase beta chain
MELFVNHNSNSLFLELLNNYSQARESKLINILKLRNETGSLLKLPELPFLVTSSGQLLSDPQEIAEWICKISGTFEIMYGRTNNEVLSNNVFIRTLKGFVGQGNSVVLEYLNKHLENSTFCNGFHITVSDLFAYSHVISLVLGFGDSDKQSFCNIIRWVDHIQNMKGLKEDVRELKLKVNLPFEPLFFENETKETSNKKEKLKDKKEKGKEPSKHEQHNVNKEQDNGEKKEKKSEEKKCEQQEKKCEQQEKKCEQPQQTEKKQQEKKQQEKKPAKQQTPADDTHPISKLDIRVGKIVNIFENKDSEKLYNEEIDIGNGEVRKIASGLKGKVPIENLANSYVIVLCNLKPRPLCGWTSHGMILCAKDQNDNIEPIRPAAGSKEGDQVFIGDYPRTPVPELNAKKNPWEMVMNDMIVNEEKVATYQNTSLWKTDLGLVKSTNLTNAKIS